MSAEAIEVRMSGAGTTRTHRKEDYLRSFAGLGVPPDADQYRQGAMADVIASARKAGELAKNITAKTPQATMRQALELAAKIVEQAQAAGEAAKKLIDGNWITAVAVDAYRDDINRKTWAVQLDRTRVQTLLLPGVVYDSSAVSTLISSSMADVVDMFIYLDIFLAITAKIDHASEDTYKATVGRFVNFGKEAAGFSGSLVDLLANLLKVGGWMARNALWIVGGLVLVGGGTIGYIYLRDRRRTT